MITGPLFKWFGSKWMASRHYPAPACDTIFEPFAGSAGYSLRHHEKRVVLYESNEQLLNLWAWLIGAADEKAILAIPIDLPVGSDIRHLSSLNEGQKLLLKHWQRTNNVGNCWTISLWGNKHGQWTTSIRERVAREVSAIKHWEIRRPSWAEVGTYFVDPPYLYNYKYRVEGFDYAGLMRNVARVPSGSQIIACEAVCPKTGAVPAYLPFVPSHLQVTSRRKAAQSHHSSELVYVKIVP